jgi:hypothetical protein
MANSQNTLVRRETRGVINGTSLEDMLERLGVESFNLRPEQTRIDETPQITWRTFSTKFGGRLRHEWPNCYKVPGYSRILCANIAAQPYAPAAPGKCGLVLRFPAMDLPLEGDGHIFHIFLFQRGMLCYEGGYRWSNNRVDIDWADLSSTVRLVIWCCTSLTSSVVPENMAEADGCQHSAQG